MVTLPISRAIIDDKCETLTSTQTYISYEIIKYLVNSYNKLYKTYTS